MVLVALDSTEISDTMHSVTAHSAKNSPFTLVKSNVLSLCLPASLLCCLLYSSHTKKKKGREEIVGSDLSFR